MARRDEVPLQNRRSGMMASPKVFTRRSSIHAPRSPGATLENPDQQHTLHPPSLGTLHDVVSHVRRSRRSLTQRADGIRPALTLHAGVPAEPTEGIRKSLAFLCQCPLLVCENCLAESLPGTCFSPLLDELRVQDFLLFAMAGVLGAPLRRPGLRERSRALPGARILALFELHRHTASGTLEDPFGQMLPERPFHRPDGEETYPP